MYKFIIILIILFTTSLAFGGTCKTRPITIEGIPVKYYQDGIKMEIMVNGTQSVIYLNGFKPQYAKNRKISIPNCHKGIANNFFHCPNH